MWITILVVLALIEVGLPLLLFLVRDRVTFFPSTRPTPEEGLEWLNGRTEVALIRIPRPDGRELAAYDARPAGAEGPDTPVIIFFHGNAGNIASRAPLLEAFVAGTGVRTLLFDYSGYGGNAGSASEREVYLDGLAVYDSVVEGGVLAEQIVLYGESLGGAVALAVAAQRPCVGVVVQSSFASLSSMASRVYPWLPLAGLLVRGAFPSAERVGELECPVLVAHGARDEVIPFAEGERLYAAARPGAEFLRVEGAGHNDFFVTAGAAYLGLVGKRVRTWTGHGGVSSGE